MRKPCIYLAPKLKLSPNRQSEIPDDTHHLGVLFGASILIFENMVCSMQTVHLSYIKFSTISKQTILSFHLSPFTYEYHRMCPKWFLSLWCIRRKLCTYLAPKLTLSPNQRKWDSIWHTSSRSSIGCPNWFLSIWYVPCKLCIYLASRLALSPNRPNWASTWASTPRSTLMQDRCTVCMEHTICLEINLDAPMELLDDVCHIETVLCKISAWFVPNAP